MVQHEDCIFCKIVRGEIPSDKVYETDRVLAFRDIAAIAPVHVLVIPKEHIQSFAHLHDVELTAELVRGCQAIAEDLDVKRSGYRVATNTGPDADQSVPHLHFHVIGGRKLTHLG